MKTINDIRKDTEKARVFLTYADRDTVKLWNSLRGKDDPPIFGGWYWLKGWSEGGPFRCESAAIRDAWYRAVLKIEPPRLHSTKQIRADRAAHLRVVS